VNAVSIRHSLLAAAIVVFLVVAVAPAGAVTDPPSGERVYKQQVLIPLYDWNTGKPLIGSTPVTCQYVDTCAPGVSKTIPKVQIQPFYLVVYPKGSKFAVQCKHIPADNCPDHGPLIANGAMRLVPSVYGSGVAGHDHISAPLASSDYRVIASPVLVLFKTRKAAQEHVVTKARIMQLVKEKQAFLYPAPQYMFINYIVAANQYALGKNVKPKPTKLPK
jgi:hypothetical protein